MCYVIYEMLISECDQQLGLPFPRFCLPRGTGHGTWWNGLRNDICSETDRLECVLDRSDLLELVWGIQMSLLAAAEVESFAVLLADKWDKFGKTLARSSVVSRSTVDRTVTHQHNAMRLILVKKGNVFTSRRNARNVSAVLSPEILLPSDLLITACDKCSLVFSQWYNGTETDVTLNLTHCFTAQYSHNPRPSCSQRVSVRPDGFASLHCRCLELTRRAGTRWISSAVQPAKRRHAVSH